jgi:hypothetical protein
MPGMGCSSIADFQEGHLGFYVLTNVSRSSYEVSALSCSSGMPLPPVCTWDYGKESVPGRVMGL